MHQKFLIFDGNCIIQGTYNLTNNARLNNEESVIVSHDEETVKTFEGIFTDLITKATQVKPAGFPKRLINNLFKSKPALKVNSKVEDNKPEAPEEHLPVEVTGSRSLEEQFEKVVDSIIAVEVDDFSKGEAIEEGYLGAKNSEGSPELVANILDTIHSNIIKSISEVTSDVTVMMSKLDSYLAKTKLHLAEEKAIKVKALKDRTQIRIQTLEGLIVKLENEIETLEEQNHQIENKTIPGHTDTIKESQDRIDNIKLEAETMPKNRFKLVFAIFASIILAFFIFFFYSSAGYIMIFSAEDVKAAIGDGIRPTEPSPFNPNAFTNAAEHGLSSIILICLMVILPLSLAGLSMFLKRAKVLICIVAALIFDFFVAFKVAQSTFEANSLVNGGTATFETSSIFFDSNFWMVLVLGTGAIILLHLLIKHMHTHYTLHKMNIPSIEAGKEIKLLEDKIEDSKSKVQELKESMLSNRSRVLNLKTTNQANAKQVTDAQQQLENDLTDLELTYNRREEYFDNQVIIKKSLIERFNMPIKASSMKNRIAFFVKGWSKFLYEEFSVHKAAERTEHIQHATNQWLATNFK